MKKVHISIRRDVREHDDSVYGVYVEKIGKWEDIGTVKQVYKKPFKMETDYLLLAKEMIIDYFNFKINKKDLDSIEIKDLLKLIEKKQNLVFTYIDEPLYRYGDVYGELQMISLYELIIKYHEKDRIKLSQLPDYGRSNCPHCGGYLYMYKEEWDIKDKKKEHDLKVKFSDDKKTAFIDVACLDCFKINTTVWNASKKNPDNLLDPIRIDVHFKNLHAAKSYPDVNQMVVISPVKDDEGAIAYSFYRWNETYVDIKKLSANHKGVFIDLD